MKKLLSVLVGLVLAVSAAGGAVTAFADDTTADLTPDFSDNFDSYSTEGFYRGRCLFPPELGKRIDAEHRRQ